MEEISALALIPPLPALNSSSFPWPLFARKSPLKGGTTNEEEDPERAAPGTDWSGTLAATIYDSLFTPLPDPWIPTPDRSLLRRIP